MRGATEGRISDLVFCANLFFGVSRVDFLIVGGFLGVVGTFWVAKPNLDPKLCVLEWAGYHFGC